MKKIILFIFLASLVFSCKSPEARRPISQTTGSYIDKAIERNKKLVAAEEKQIQEIIEKDTANEYISSPYGFWYFYNERDTTTTTTPQFGDIVEFDYEIKTLEGQTIYSEAELSPKTYRMDQEELFTGLREGLKLMQEGETLTFLFPSHKAFGFYGDKDRIGTNRPIMSTVTLKEINQNNNNQNSNQINN